MYIDEIFSYNKKGTFNNAMLNATDLGAPKSLKQMSQALFYLVSKVNTKINRRRIMA